MTFWEFLYFNLMEFDPIFFYSISETIYGHEIFLEDFSRWCLQLQYIKRVSLGWPWWNWTVFKIKNSNKLKVTLIITTPRGQFKIVQFVEYPGAEFVRTAHKFRQRKKNSLSCVHVLRQAFYVVIPPNSKAFFDWTRTCHVPWVKTV